MKIISKTHDYYDGIARSFFDDELVFHRTTELITIPWLDYPSSSQSKLNSNGICLLNFCGKIYPMFVIENPDENKFISILDQSELSQYAKSEREYSYLSHHFNIFEDPVYLKSPQSFLNRPDKELENHIAGIPLTKEMPYFLVIQYRRESDIKIITNPNLKDLKFNSIKDPYQAYQELAMLFSRLNTKEEKINAGIEDKYLIKAKGFDCKSFRKEPTKRKAKSCDI